jgi:uncharacterized membrane protein
MDNEMRPYGPGPMRIEDNHHPGALGWVIFALELLMLAALIFLIVRSFMPARRRSAPAQPLAQLQMRYANGQISRDEYLQAERDLRGEELPAS